MVPVRQRSVQWLLPIVLLLLLIAAACGDDTSSSTAATAASRESSQIETAADPLDPVQADERTGPGPSIAQGDAKAEEDAADPDSDEAQASSGKTTEVSSSAQAVCEVDFHGGAAIPDEIQCTNGISLSVEGPDRTGWNGKLSAYELSENWSVDALVEFWGRNSEGAWAQYRDSEMDQVGPGTTHYGPTTERPDELHEYNDRVQALVVHVDGPGSLTICSDVTAASKQCAGSMVTFKPWKG